MAALSWLLIPVFGALVAALWGTWAARRRKPAPDAAGVAGYERFRAAMERSRDDSEPAPVPVEEPQPAHR